MEPEGLLPCSQDPVTGLYPELDLTQSTNSHPIPLISSLILYSQLRQG